MGEIVRTRTVSFTADRLPMPRKIRLGMEGDNLVERLRFALPVIAEHQTATLVITGRADAVTLEYDAENGYYIDLTREIVGPDGETEAYIIIDGAGGESWRSDVMRLITGALPDVDEDIEQRYPGAVETMLGKIAEHNAEMEQQTERVEQAVQRAEDAAQRAEAGGGGGGTGSPGNDGGYYQPSVTDGVLTWTPSKTDMPSVPESDIRGPKGEPGEGGKTAYQYAQDGGYTGTEAEFAAKMAQEIPEVYELPVATADRLGGVMIGRGLQVGEDGRTAVIPDNKYEILHTTTLEEAVPWIAFNLPDCTHLYIEFIVPPNDDGSDMILPAAVVQLRGASYAKSYSGQRKISNGNPLYVYWRCGVDHGMLCGDTGYARNATSSVVSVNLIGHYYGTQNEIGFGTFNEIHWGSVSGVIPLGTVITVKGVRANV